MNKITVHMTKEFLYDFLLFHAYSKFSGFLINILGLAIAFVGVFMYASGKTGLVSVAFYLLASVAFLGSMPFQLKKRAKKQVELNPEYREPVEFAFSEEEGITAAFGESERNYPWEQILRAVVTPKTIGIYYEAERALIIPKQDFGEQFGDIFQMIARHLGMNRVRMR
ncbi:YcxB family protein [Lachnospiraceae bacterium 42-17]|jgi:hypothetical protein|nr:YcxB family protein [Dorea sp.]